jgi:uncharacterized membrane protein YkvA (DUF1232 family)
MKKAKARAPAARKKTVAKVETEASPGLKQRLEAEFARSVKSAKSYVDDPQRLQDLFQEASKQAAALPKDSFKETWPYLQTMLRLIRAYYRGEYRALTESTLIVIVAAIIYIVSPLDAIPDAIPALGFLDDATVLTLAIRRARQDLDDFMTWETLAN